MKIKSWNFNFKKNKKEKKSKYGLPKLSSVIFQALANKLGVVTYIKAWVGDIKMWTGTSL